jgi:hypothetical protein
MPILDSLRHRPSRASAAAIGHGFVLNGAPPAVGMLGVDALCEMICDWSVAILEEAINDPSRNYGVRRHALERLCQLVMVSIDRGYTGIAKVTCSRLAHEAEAELKVRKGQTDFQEIQAVEDLCGHLSQAVADGVFGELPDF